MTWFLLNQIDHLITKKRELQSCLLNFPLLWRIEFQHSMEAIGLICKTEDKPNQFKQDVQISYENWQEKIKTDVVLILCTYYKRDTVLVQRTRYLGSLGILQYLLYPMLQTIVITLTWFVALGKVKTGSCPLNKHNVPFSICTQNQYNTCPFFLSVLMGNLDIRPNEPKNVVLLTSTMFLF